MSKMSNELVLPAGVSSDDPEMLAGSIHEALFKSNEQIVIAVQQAEQLGTTYSDPKGLQKRLRDIRSDLARSQKELAKLIEVIE